MLTAVTMKIILVDPFHFLSKDIYYKSIQASWVEQLITMNVSSNHALESKWMNRCGTSRRQILSW